MLTIEANKDQAEETIKDEDEEEEEEVTTILRNTYNEKRLLLLLLVRCFKWSCMGLTWWSGMGPIKKLKYLSDENWKQCPNGWGVGSWGILYDEWWVMSDENWVRSDEWWKKKKIQTRPKPLSLDHSPSMVVSLLLIGLSYQS